MSGTYNIDIASIQEACPICTKAINDSILMGKKLHKGNNKLEHLNGKIVGFSKEPCTDCQELQKKGFILIGIVPTEDEKDLANPFRSGHMWVVTHDFIDRVFKKDFINGRQWSFIDVAAAEQLGLPLKTS